MALKLTDKYARGFVREHELSCMQPQISAAHELLHSGKGAGSDFIQDHRLIRGIHID